MVKQDSRILPLSARRKPRTLRKSRPLNEFERFKAKCELTDKEKSALPSSLRRMLGWE
jgi:hypothetical protein